MMRKRLNLSKPGAPVPKLSRISSTNNNNQIDDLVPAHIKVADILTIFHHLSGHYELYRKAEKFPKIVMKHQFYSVVENRTNVDQTIHSLQATGKLRVFKTSLGTDQFCTMLTPDYIDYVQTVSKLTTDDQQDSKSENPSPMECKRRKVLTKFLEELVPCHTDVDINIKTLTTTYKFTDSQITLLIKDGVLTSKDAGCWWLAIPNVGKFLKTLRKGRSYMLQTIRRAKYKELSVKNILARKPPNSVRLGWHFHVHDLVGADLVTVIKSTTSTLLRVVGD